MDVFDQIVTVAGSEALATFDAHQRQCSQTRLWPLIVGDDDDLARLRDLIAPPADGGAAILAQAAAFDVEAWLADKIKRKPSWPKKPLPPLTAPTSLYDVLSGKLKPRVHIVLVRVENMSEIFAKLGFGDWNDCPPPHIHVALHRHWWNTYRSRPIALRGDTVECFLTQPPAEKAAALALAAEHNAYCYDIVEQGAGTVGKLASSLLGAKFWYFWWD